MDKRFYEAAAIEVGRGIVDPALMAKAIAQSEGNELKAQATYLTLRAEELQASERKARVEEVTKEAGRVASGAASGCGLLLARLVPIAGILILLVVLVGIFGAFMDRRNAVERQNASRTPSQAQTPPSSSEAGQYSPQQPSINSENARYNAMLDRLEAVVPKLNPNSSAFSVFEAQRMQGEIDARIRRGVAPIDALKGSAAFIYGVDLSGHTESNSASVAPLSTPPQLEETTAPATIEARFPPRNAQDQACLDQYSATMESVSDDLPLGDYVAIRERNELRLKACMGR